MPRSPTPIFDSVLPSKQRATPSADKLKQLPTGADETRSRSTHLWLCGMKVYRHSGANIVRIPTCTDWLPSSPQ
jgi:hypothetical protein